MKIDIVGRPAVRVAFLRYTGPMGEPVSRFWRTAVAPWLAEHGLLDCPRYGVTLDNPMTTPPEKCRYDACVELPPGLALPDAQQGSIAGGAYAITQFKGSGAQIGAAWSTFIAEYLASPAHRLDETRPPFEHYPRGSHYDPRSSGFGCVLCLPVAESQ